MSPVRRFKTAPPIGSPQKFTALVYGDMGVSPVPRAYKTAAYATQEAMNGSADFVFHNGDISYARGYVRFEFMASLSFISEQLFQA